eukprot:TRINITY_DN261_c1_g1_i1.p1 TRINITY_DN261_c1_g1~~TRINITY_DN261_c1_g1_i1.p1  ORF type:complete len:451 (-),score=68.12 TRINITY_DN261_c1_g1_i1:77-1429(-)
MDAGNGWTAEMWGYYAIWLVVSSVNAFFLKSCLTYEGPTVQTFILTATLSQVLSGWICGGFVLWWRGEWNAADCSSEARNSHLEAIELHEEMSKSLPGSGTVISEGHGRSLSSTSLSMSASGLASSSSSSTSTSLPSGSQPGTTGVPSDYDPYHKQLKPEKEGKRGIGLVTEMNWYLAIAAWHTLGNALTNYSMGMAAVAFTQTVKAAEPIFSMFLASLFLGEVVSPTLYATIVPIVCGVALTSFTELNFQLGGLVTALLSNLAFASRNIFSKEVLLRPLVQNNQHLVFYYMSKWGTLLLLPLFLCLEMTDFVTVIHSMTGPQIQTLVSVFLLSGITHSWYNQFSYVLLARMSPITHGVASVTKRAVLIASAMIYYSVIVVQNKTAAMSDLDFAAVAEVERKSRNAKIFNVLGIALVLVGVGWYSWLRKSVSTRQGSKRSAERLAERSAV